MKNVVFNDIGREIEFKPDKIFEEYIKMNAEDLKDLLRKVKDSRIALTHDVKMKMDIDEGLEIKSYEWGTFYGDIKSGNFQITTMRWVGVTEPDFYYDIFHSSQVPPTGRNRGRYINQEIDKLTQTGRTTLDPAKRKELYTRTQMILAEDLPYISLWHMNNISIIHNRVNGYRQHPMAGFFSFKEIDLD